MAAVTMFPGADLFKSQADVLVNATNASYIMGAGLALSFRLKFPGYYTSYMNADLVPGVIHTYKYAAPPPKAIVSLHTMLYPGEPGDIPMIKEGLVGLAMFMVENDYKSAAIPALGCGIGRLDWRTDVLPLIRQINTFYPDLRWDAYPPT